MSASYPAPDSLTPNRSTGPRTPEGKARSSMNAVTHGLTAKTPLLPGEDPQEFREFVWGIVEDLGPQGPVQLELVHRAAVLMWKRRRINDAEDTALMELKEEYREQAQDRLDEKEEFSDTPEDFKKLEEAKAEEAAYGAVWDAHAILAHQFGSKPGALDRLARYEQRICQQIDSTIRLLLKLQNRKEWLRGRRGSATPQAADPVPPPPPAPAQNELNPERTEDARTGCGEGWTGPPGVN